MVLTCHALEQADKKAFDSGVHDNFHEFQTAITRIITHGDMPTMAMLPKVFVDPIKSVPWLTISSMQKLKQLRLQSHAGYL